MAETAENSTAAQTQEVKQPMKIGKVERVTMTFPQEQNNTTGDSDNTNLQNNEGANAIKDANEAVVVDKTAAAPTSEINEDALKAYFEKAGIKYDGLDALKEKLTAPTPQTEPTEAEKEKKEIATLRRMEDLFLAGGGTANQWQSLLELNKADTGELSKNLLKSELKTAGFSDEQVEAIIKERYYQYDEDELLQEVDETDKEYKTRLKKHFAEKLANRALPIKKQIGETLEGLRKAINSEDLQVQQEVAISAKIDEDFKALPRKEQVVIGDIGGGKIASPIDYDYDESVIESVKAELKDPAKRQQYFFNQDGTPNTTELAKLIVKARSFDSMAKISYLEAQTRTNEQWQKTFPARSAQELGVGGSQAKPNGQKGQATSFGKTERTKAQPQQA